MEEKGRLTAASRVLQGVPLLLQKRARRDLPGGRCGVVRRGTRSVARTISQPQDREMLSSQQKRTETVSLKTQRPALRS